MERERETRKMRTCKDLLKVDSEKEIIRIKLGREVTKEILSRTTEETEAH